MPQVAQLGAEPVRESASAGGPPAVPAFRILAPLGLALAAVTLVALVVAVVVDATWPLDFMHVVFG
ncbi:hypothetical protein, partial [Acinetobacter sp.]|uniref:hypothetical protein n=1 Tax=Acinetobacter sp. TaxID=472 RepID=UPI00258668E5